MWNFHHHEPQPFEIVVREGVQGLIASISTELKTTRRETLGILVDSNDDPKDRWKKIVHSLRTLPGMEIPESPTENGFVSNNTKPRIGIWLMPNNRCSGELEDFISKLIPGDDPIWPRAKQFIEDIPKNHRKFTDKKELRRAKIHAWLATQGAPGPIGTAIRARDLNHSAPIAEVFYKWLHRLFIGTT